MLFFFFFLFLRPSRFDHITLEMTKTNQGEFMQYILLAISNKLKAYLKLQNFENNNNNNNADFYKHLLSLYIMETYGETHFIDLLK